MFVAVGQTSESGKCVATSIDGVTWIIQDTPASVDIWLTACQGGGKFVALGPVNATSPNGQQVMTSPDGVTWTLRGPLSLADAGWAVCYGNRLFVALSNPYDANDGEIFTSPDGINWTARALPDGVTAWSASIAYGNGRFVAIAEGQSLTSTDGVTWLASTAPDGEWGNLCFGNGRFVVASYWTGDVAVSLDGVTWTTYAGALDEDWAAMCFGDGLFVATTYNDTVETSLDGVTWNTISVPTGTYGLIYFGNGVFTALSQWDGATITSPDGTNWTSNSGIGEGDWFGLTHTLPITFTGLRVAQEGDVRLYHTVDGGEINTENGVTEMDGGLFNAVYLSLFGGNMDDDGSTATASKQWWGNVDEQDPRKLLRSETQALLKAMPAVLANLRRVELAVARDLRWMTEEKIVKTVSVIVSLIARNTVQITVTLNNTDSVIFKANWGASHA